MKIKTVISPRIINRETNPKDKIQALNFSVIAAALIFGTVIFLLCEDYLAEDILMSFKAFFTDFTQKTYFEIFTGLLLSHMPYIILMVIFGTCVFSRSFILILSFVKITGLSILNAAIFSEFGLKGIEYALLVFFPGKFILILSVLIMMNSCIDNSRQINSTVKGDYKTNYSSNLYIPKVTAAILLYILSMVIDCFFTVSFSSLFSF